MQSAGWPCSFFRAEADKQRVFRDEFVRQMHLAAVKLHLLLESECDCGAGTPGHQPFTSQCERAAIADLAAHTKEDPESESSYARIAAKMLRQRSDATGGEEVSL